MSNLTMIRPYNNYVRIEVLNNNKSDTGLVLYSTLDQDSKYCYVKITDVDPTSNIRIDSKAVVLAHLVEKFEVDQEEFNFCPTSAIIFLESSV